MAWISPIGVRLVPSNFGPLKEAHGSARIRGECGDTMEIWLRVEDQRIVQAGFTSDGCETSVACGSMAAHLSQGLDAEALARLTPLSVLDALGAGDDEEAHHCADLALRTLRRAFEAGWSQGRAIPEVERSATLG